MLKSLGAIYLTLALVWAESDPRAGWCDGRCEEWRKLTRKCFNDKNCYPNGVWDKAITFDCISRCSMFSVPGRKSCFECFPNGVFEVTSSACLNQCINMVDACKSVCYDAFDICSNRCEGACFETCFSDKFKPGTLNP